MDPEVAYRRYFPLILQHARRVLGDGAQAQDVAQETFLRFLRAKVTEGGDAGVVAWLYRSSANLAIDAIRKRRQHVGVDDLRPVAAPETLEAGVSLRSALQQLARVLPGDVLEAGVLGRANGLSQAELAAVLDVSERTVRRYLTAFEQAASSLSQEAPS